MNDMLELIHKKHFGDFMRLNSPEWLLSLKKKDLRIYVLRYSRLQEFREYLRSTELVKAEYYLIMDDHLGKYGVPNTGFTAITPYGFFDASVSKINIKDWEYAWDGIGCVSCAFGAFPCEEHLTTAKENATVKPL